MTYRGLESCIKVLMRSGDREPVQGGEKGSRSLLIVVLGVIVLLMASFLIIRPRGSEAGPGNNRTTQH